MTVLIPFPDMYYIPMKYIHRYISMKYDFLKALSSAHVPNRHYRESRGRDSLSNTITILQTEHKIVLIKNITTVEKKC